MIRIGIAGYGNLGRGVEAAVTQNGDIELKAVFTRRDPSSLKISTAGIPVVNLADAPAWQDKLDVMVICGGSATDLPHMTPELAKYFNVVDSFDTHADINKHFANVDAVAKASGHTAVISAGWDPGLFSVSRIYASAALPVGESYTFWGPGVSQGHSDAVRRIEGVVDARQYTLPVASAVESVRKGENPQLSAREKHTRLVYVAVREGADTERIEREIKTMPKYFDEYDTTVNFVSLEELKADHSGLPHGGSVIRSGVSALGHKQNIEFSLKLESNPYFTSGILVACARAAAKMHADGDFGAHTMADIRPRDLLPLSGEELRAHMI